MRTLKDKIKWKLRRMWVRWKRVLKMKSKIDRPKRPTKLNESQSMAVDIIIKSILDSTSELYYDIESQECYIKRIDPSGDIFFFLEPRNIKMVNTVFGYDIEIDINTENYISAVFKRELNKRRSKFKRDAVAKVEFSLQKALRKINRSGR